MRKYLVVFLLIIIIIAAVIYHNNFSEKEITVYAMDTVMTIKIKGNEKYLIEAEHILRDIDSKYNAYNKNSYVYKLNTGEITHVPEDVAELLKVSLSMCYDTDGNFNIALKELKDLWNLTSEHPSVPTETQIAKALLSSDYTKIRIIDNNVYLNGAKIDLGGIVKGYAADCIVEMLKNNGVKEAIIDLGGNIYAYSNKESIKVGIQKPFSTRGDVACVIDVNNKAVISSGTYERYFKKGDNIYHHIFDPKTGYPANNSIDAVTVLGSNSAKCDAYSTALLVMGKEKAVEFYNKHNDFEFAMLSKANIFCSAGFETQPYDNSFVIEKFDD